MDCDFKYFYSLRVVFFRLVLLFIVDYLRDINCYCNAVFIFRRCWVRRVDRSLRDFVFSAVAVKFFFFF